MTPLLSRLRRRLRSILRPDALERDLDDELRFHLDREIERLIADGMSRRDARAAALRAFGGFERSKNEMRDANGVRLASELRQDVRYAVRTIRRDPGLALIVIATLALVIGGNTAVFSVVDGILLKPLGLPSADRLVVVAEQTPVRPAMGVAYPDFLDWQLRQSTFENMAASLVVGGIVSGGGEPERVFGRAVTRTFFATLGVEPFAGRSFSAAEDRPGGDRVIVLGHALWQRRFGGDPGAIGRTVNYNGDPYTVVGVLPAGFEFYGRSNANNDYFLPLGQLAGYDYMRDRDSHPVRVVGRLRPGVTIARAQADLGRIAAALAAEYPASNRSVGVRMASLLEDYVGDVRLALSMLMAAALLVLVIACANIASLLVARAGARQREIAVRLALGAGRARLLRQLLTESLVLSALGGAAGLLLGVAATRAASAFAATSLPRVSEIGLDWRVLAFTAMLAAGTGLAFGAAPALQMIGVDLRRFLSDGGRAATPSARRVREGLVAAQLALCVAVLAAAALLVRSFDALLRVDPGFAPSNVVTMRVRLPDGRYRDRGRVLAVLDDIRTRVARLPGVESACLTTGVPFGRINEERFSVEGEAEKPRDRMPVAATQWVSADYHRTFGIGLIAGRLFTVDDRAEQPAVAIVDDEFVRKTFPGLSPDAALNRRVQLASEPRQWRQIVGVVRHIRHAGLDEQPRPELYVPYVQMEPGFQLEIGRAMDLAIRSSQDPGAAVAAVRRELSAIDTELPLSHVRTMDEALSLSIAPRTFNLALIGMFAVLALVLCVVGLYGMVSYSVAQRTREIGVRVALGASPGEVIRLVMRSGGRAVLLGFVFGFAGAIVAGRLLRDLLYAVAPADPLAFAAAAVLLAAAAAVAAFVPARRATRLDPVAALRAE